MKKIKINIPGHPYNVYVGRNVFEQLVPKIHEGGLSKNALFVIDENVVGFHTKVLEKMDRTEFKKVSTLVIKATEPLKSRLTLEKIYKKLLDENFGRDSIIVAIGGGITGDISGYAAATFMRGIQYIQIPTTLLAAVDSSVGGKTGINFSNTKNIIGAFKQPEFVLIDTDFFQTLPRREIICGIGEVMKYAYLTDKKLFDFISNELDDLIGLKEKVVENVIIETVKFKGAVVEADEKETGLRKILNLGHTFAHAVEVDQKYKIKHGEAVVVGLACSLFLSRKLNLFTNQRLNEFLALPLQLKKKIRIKKYDLAKMIDTMSRDKKNRDNKIKFVLVKDIAQIIPDVEAGIGDVKYAVTEAIKLFQ
ncbi:MAG: 3-dehydroquinate synthase [bacterium]